MDHCYCLITTSVCIEVVTLVKIDKKLKVLEGAMATQDVLRKFALYSCNTLI